MFPGLYTAEFWHYDSRLIRRWEPDPITYHWQSPYACFNNDPIGYADPLGLEGQGGEGEFTFNKSTAVKDGFSKTSSAGGDIYTKKIPVSGTPTAPTNAINHCQNDAIKSVNKTVDYQRLMQTPNTSGNTNSIADLARSADAWLARFSTGNSQPDGYNLTTTGEGGTGSGTKATKNPNPQTFNIDVLLDIYNYKHFGTGLDPKRSFDLVDVVTDAIQEVPNSNSVIIQAFKESDLLHKKPETREVMEFNTHFGKMRSVRGIKAGTPYDSIYPGYLKGMTFEEYLNHPKRKTVIGKY